MSIVRRGAGLILVAAALTACSVVFNFDADQCSSDRDCTARGGQFAQSTCERGVCRSLNDQAHCSLNADCSGPTLCKAGKCVNITSSDCPIVAGEQSLRAAEPIVFGAYAPLPPLNPAVSNEFRNYELAVGEFNSEAGGLVGGPNGARRPFAVVTCQTTTDTNAIDRSMNHLIDDVGVAGIIAALSPETLRVAFETHAHQSGVFLLGLYLADSVIVNEVDDGLLWNLIPDAKSMSGVYKPLFARIEQYLNLGAPLRVAFVEGTRRVSTDLADAVAESVTFSGDFRRFKLPPAEEDPQAATNIVTTLLTDQKPDLIVSFAGDDFLQRVLPPLESSWKTLAKTPLPFYVLSPTDPFGTALSTYVQSNQGMLKRALGVNIESAADKTLYNQYIGRFLKAYPAAQNYESLETFYDAPYYLMYAFAGAGNIGQFTGADLVRGMKRLIDMNASTNNGTRFSVGPSDVGQALTVLGLSSSGKIGLWGAGGPPDFDEITGVYRGQGSVWCFCSGNSSVVFDAMRFDKSNNTLTGGNPCCPFGP